jgi:hypothetical protein
MLLSGTSTMKSAGIQFQYKCRAGCGVMADVKARWRMAILAVAGVLAPIVGFVKHTANEPVYQGKRLSYWFHQYARQTPQMSEATNAIAHLGGRAVPYLVRVLERGISPWQRAYNIAWGLLPQAQSKRLPPPRWRDEASYSALEAVTLVGPAAGKAVPAIINLLNDRDVELRRAAPQTLGRLGPLTRSVVPALVMALTNGDWYAEENAVRALGAMGPAASNAIPALVIELKHVHPDFRSYAAEALGNVGPGARMAIPALLTAMRDQNPMVREAARSALLRIDATAATKAEYPRLACPRCGGVGRNVVR